MNDEMREALPSEKPFTLEGAADAYYHNFNMMPTGLKPHISTETLRNLYAIVVEPIIQAAYQAAYQLQQAKIEELEKELELHSNPPEFRQLPHEH